MNQKTVKTLGIATAVALVGAAAFSALRDRGTAARSTDERILPALEDRINDVRTVVIENQQGTMTLTAAGDGWALDEMSGYPADAGKIRTLLLAFRDARRLEEKTSDPSKYSRLGLDAPDAEGSRSTRLTLKDGGGEVLGAVLVGNRRMAKSGGAPLDGGGQPAEQYYVHPGGEGPTFLALGSMRIDPLPTSWVDPQILDVGRERISSVRIAHPDGEVVSVVREEMSSDGMVPKDPPGTGPFIGALTRLRFEDVTELDEIDWEANPVTTAEYFTEHGLRVTVESVEIDEADGTADPEEAARIAKDDARKSTVWSRYRFDVAPDQAPALPEAEDAMGPEPADDDASTEGDDPAEMPADDGPSAADLQAEADRLTAVTAGWAYSLPGWKAVAFRMRMERLAEPAPEPEPEAPDETAAPKEDAAGDGQGG